MFDLVRKVGARGLLVAAIAAAAALLSSPADAHGWHGRGGWHSSVYVGIGGFYDPWWPGSYPGYWGPAYYPYYADPPVTAIQQAPIVQAPVVQAPPVYYYCDNPGGYYPYVQQCSQPWRPVAVQPPPVAPPHQ